MKYAVKFRNPNDSADNPSVVTFHTASQSEAEADEIAARLCAMFVVLVFGGGMTTGIVEEISVSPDSGGTGRLLFPKGAEVDAFISAYNATGGFQSATFGASMAEQTIIGVPLAAVGDQFEQLPKGISTLLIEQPANGPKGRLYLPYPPQSANNAIGDPMAVFTEGVRRTIAVFYGFFAGTPLFPKVFGVKSASGFSLILGVRVSPVWSHLKSRTR